MTRKLSTLATLFAAGAFVTVTATPAMAAPRVQEEKKDAKDHKCGKEGKDHKCGKDAKDHKCGKDKKDSKDHKCGKDKKDAKAGGEKSCGAGSCSSKK